MKPIHNLLNRQLKQYFGESFQPPKAWHDFIDAIGDIYRESDINREQLKRSQELEEQLSKLAATAPGVIHAYRIRPDGNRSFVYANPSIENIYGFKPEDLIHDATPALDRTYPDDRPRIRESVKRSMREMSLWREEFRVNHPQKGIIWVEGCSSPVREADGSVLWHGFLLDITERKKSEMELRHTISLFRSIFDSTADGILVVDNAGRMVSFNERFTSLWHMPQEILDSRNDDAALNHAISQLKEPDVFLSKVRELYATPEKESFDVLEFRDGRVFERYSRPQQLDGKPIGRVWSFRDVTNSKLTEEELRGKTALLEAQLHSSTEGILVVDNQGKKILQNQRTIDLWKIPKDIVDDNDDQKQVQFVMNQTKNPDRFVEKVIYLYSHPNEVSRDEVELKDGTILDRYSSPVIGKDGKRYGRIWSFRDITERKQAEDTIAHERQLLRTLIDLLPETFYIKDLESRFLVVNAALARHFGKGSPSEILGLSDADFFPAELFAKFRAKELKILNGEAFIEQEDKGVSPTGRECTYLTTKVAFRDSQGKIQGLVGIGRDITESKKAEAERKELEAKLRQSQKMEAFGQLAAGVAHDFNNILTVILGNLALLQTGQLSKDEAASALTQSLAAAERAAGLTRQLLTFGRRQVMQPVDLDLNKTVSQMTKMLQRLIGENVALEARYMPGDAMVHADLGMMEQAIMNLALNSRDAMPKGGKLIIHTDAISITDVNLKLRPKARTGEFIRITVRDTGLGIPAENLPKIFEPFFTTKEVGKGTGLGLATVFGIIEQHQGWIEVESELNQGTTFQLFLPQFTPKT